MAESRMVRSSILTSEPVNALSWPAEIFYRRLMSVADDFGRFEAKSAILRASLYPLKLNQVSEADVVKWMTECVKTGLVSHYEVEGKEYLEILKFGQRLRIQQSKYPPPSAAKCGEVRRTAARRDTDKDTDIEKETIPKTPDGVTGAIAPANDSPDYKSIEKTKKGIYDFIKSKPTDIQPYVDFWNLFAQEKGLAQVQKVSDQRKRKFRVRIKEPAFNFPEILRKAGQSEFLLTGKWFGFDWIMENDSNYLKVIEGNYDKKEKQLNESTSSINQRLKAARKEQG